MPRLPMIDLDRSPESIRKFVGQLPKPLHIFETLAHAESHFLPMMNLVIAINTAQELSYPHREIAILYAVHRAGGEYEWVQHESLAEDADVSQAQRDAIRAGDLDDSLWDDAERALLHYAQQVVDQVKADDAVWKTLRAHFSDREVVEITLILGVYRTLAAMTENAETPIDQAEGRRTLDAMRD